MISSKKFNLIAAVSTMLIFLLSICSVIFPDAVSVAGNTGAYVYGNLHSVTVTEDDYYTSYAESLPIKINLNGDYADSKSSSVSIDGSDITILGGGIYVLSGTLQNGSITVDSADNKTVRLILNGVDITSSDFSALYVKRAAKTIISLIDGTTNTLTDASLYNEQKQEYADSSAALYSKDDLVINGGGTLVVNANYADGIKTCDTLKITEGNIFVTAADDGINANDFIFALDVTLTVAAQGDAIKCKNDEEEKGFVAFEETTLKLTSENDGMDASSAIYLNDVTADITSGGGSENRKNNSKDFFDKRTPTTDTASQKAIKAGASLVIQNGVFNLNSADDALHSDKDITIEQGVYTISSGDDAVHADLTLIFNPETADITDCYEGLEAAYVTVNGGEITIVSRDDGINATGENTDNAPGGFRGNNEEKTAEEDIWLTVNGGHIKIETSGDGFDSNGSAMINGGFLEIYGPEDGGNGSIDVGDGGYVLLMNGGELLAAGNSAMAEHPSESSVLPSLSFYLDKTYPSESAISLINSSGDEIIGEICTKKFNWVCISTSKIQSGEVYTLVINSENAASITAGSGVSSYNGKASGKQPDFKRTKGEIRQ